MAIFSRPLVRPLGRIESFFFGVSLPLRAAGLIFRRPTLLFWSLLPIGITVTLYIYVISAMQSRIMSWVLGQLPALGLVDGSWGARVVSFVLQLTLLVASAVTFSIAATIVASPFNDFLAESSERWMEPALPAPPGSGVGNRTRLVLIDLAKSVAAGVATAVALLISWIPAVNLVGLSLAALLVCFQYTSYAQTRRGVGLLEGLVFLIRHLWACAGFGAVLSLLFAIPIASCLFLPLAVVGGTMLVARAPGSPRHGRLR